MANSYSLSSNGSTPTGPLQDFSNRINGSSPGVMQPPNMSVNPTPQTPPPKVTGFLPSTPVKKVTAPDGTTTEFHTPPAPATSAPTVSAGVMQSSPTTSQPTTQSASPAAPSTGTPGFYANDLNNLQQQTAAVTKEYAPLVASPMGQFGIGTDPANLSNYELAREQNQLQGLSQQGTLATTGLNASLPGQVSPGNSLYNPLQGAGAFNPAEGATRGAAYSALVPAYSDMNAAQATLQNISDNTNLFNSLVPQGVNVSDATPLNQLSNAVGTLFSSQDYGKFNAILPNIISQYASYIGSTKGLSPTDAFTQASKEINQNSSIGTIKSVLNVLSQEANNTLAAKQKQYQDAASAFNTGTANVQDTSNPSTNTSTSSSLYNF